MMLNLKTCLIAFSSLLFIAAGANANDARICTGGEKGNYFYFGSILAKEVKPAGLNIEVISTNGSLDNLRKMEAGECDMAVVQSDAWTVYRNSNSNSALDLERIGIIFDEYVHLICNKDSGIEDIGDLGKSNVVAIGPNGSGSWTTWQGLVYADKTQGGDAYSQIQTNALNGSRAINAVVDGTETQCLLYVASPKTSYMNGISELASKTGSLVMAEVVDKDFNDTVDHKGKSIYETAEIDNSWYKGFGYWSNTDTVKVSAILFSNVKWAEENSKDYEIVSDVFQSVSGNVRKSKGME